MKLPDLIVGRLRNQLQEFLKAISMVARMVALNVHGLTKRLPKGYHLQIS